MGETIHLYYINDLHSHFNHWKRIQQFIRKRSTIHKSVEEEVLVMDIGDHADRFHPYTEGTLGKGNIELLNQLECDYATIGNNEGITFPLDVLDDLYREAQFEVLVANLYYADGTRPEWLQPYRIHKTKQGTRIALIGVTANFKLFYEELGWRVTEPMDEIEKAMNEVKDNCDAIILLSHLGLEYDQQLAEKFPDIHLILGAHTHHILHEGKRVNQSLLCGAGKGGTYVGHAELFIDRNANDVSVKTRLYNMNDEDFVEGETEFNSQLREIGKQKLQNEICVLDKPLDVQWFIESTLVQMLCDELKDWCNADCAFLNAGLLLEGLPKGIVTQYDIHRICPHPINPCVVELSGQELKEVLLQSMDKKWPHLQVKGFGFRGNILGIMLYSNIEVKSKSEIYIGGELIHLKKQYKLAIPDLFTFGYFFPSIKRSENKTYYLPEFLRDILAHKLSI